MGREIRMVPADWEHPMNADGRRWPLLDGYKSAVSWFMEKLGSDGLQAAIDWCGVPDKNDYMPDWPESERTHLMMYETCSEGTPISPAFETGEELARWLADNRASAFGRHTASYDEWLAMIGHRNAPSALLTVDADGRGSIQSGVSLAAKEPDDAKRDD